MGISVIIPSAAGSKIVPLELMFLIPSLLPPPAWSAYRLQIFPRYRRYIVWVIIEWPRSRLRTLGRDRRFVFGLLHAVYSSVRNLAVLEQSLADLLVEVTLEFVGKGGFCRIAAAMGEG